METLIVQMIAPEHTQGFNQRFVWTKFWTYNTRKLFRDHVRPLINYYKTMREFGECVKG